MPAPVAPTTNGNGAATMNGNGYHGGLSVIVVGAGLGGLAATIALRLAGHEVTVLEAATKLGEVGAGIQLTPNVTRLLERWGVLAALRPVAVEPISITFRRWENGLKIGRTGLVPEFERDFGAPYLVVHRAHLHEALEHRARALGADIVLATRVADVDFEARTVTSAAGKTFSADLIVGCDGIRSATRACFLDASENPGPKPTAYCAYRATVPVELLKADPATASLLEAPELNIWIGAERHVMTYPISGGETFNLVLSHPEHRPPTEWDTTKVLSEMKENYVGWDPVLCKIIDLIERTSKWQLNVTSPLSRWTHPSGSFTLMGDACHAMLPYMSQGAAQAIEDAAALGACMRRARSQADLSALLSLYESQRKARSEQVQARSALNGRIWHYADGPTQEARDRGMAATLTGEHYIRSTNQWSDPHTQVWLYGHDVEATMDAALDQALHVHAPRKVAAQGISDMVSHGLLSPC